MSPSAAPRRGITRLAVWPVAGLPLWVAVLTVVGLALRLFRLGDAPLWVDEVQTARAIARPWGPMLSATLAQAHPPVYYAGLKAWTEIFGATPTSLRLPGAVIGAATVPVAAAAARRLGGSGAARWAAVLVAISPFLVQHSREARQYALVAFLAAAMVLLVAREISGDGLAPTPQLVALSALGSFTHYFFAVFVVAVCAFLAWQPARRAPRSALGLAAAIGPSLAALALAAVTATPITVPRHSFGLELVPGMVYALVNGYTLLPSSAQLYLAGQRALVPYLPVALLSLSLIVVLVAAVASRACCLATRRILSLAALSVALLVLGAVAARAPINPRYLAPGAPAVLISLALLLDQASGWARAAGIASVAVMMTASALLMIDPGYGHEDTANAGRWLDAHVPADQVILVPGGDMGELASYAWPGHPVRTYPPPALVVNGGNVDRVAAGLPFFGQDQVVYVLGRAWWTDPQGVLVKALDRRYASCPGTTARDLPIRCYRRG